MSVNVAVVGATGAVGDLMRKVLAERRFPIKSIKFLASEKSAGKTVEFAGKPYKVELLRPEAFAGVQIVLSSTPSSVSKEFSPIAAKAGAIVVDNSSAWRMDPDCPLVVPEVNAHELHNIKKGIVANPNCVAIPLCVALKPLHDLGKVKRVVVATYQSSSGKGAKGLVDFEAQLKAWAAGGPVPAPTAHRAQLAGNVITLDWTLDANGFTEEENKVINETKKILGDASIGVCPTCVRVPVKVSHSEAITVEFHKPVSVEAAKAAFASAPGVVLMDETKGQCPQPIHAEGSDHTFVGRVRQDPSNPNALCLWVVADNLRKGAASNAVQCAKEVGEPGDREVNDGEPLHSADLTPFQRKSLQRTRQFLDTPPTLSDLYRMNGLRYVFLIVLVGGVIAAYAALEFMDVAIFIAGVLCGILLRDWSAFRVFIRIWPVSAAIIDRDRLDELLQEHGTIDGDDWNDGA